MEKIKAIVDFAEENKENPDAERLAREKFFPGKTESEINSEMLQLKLTGMLETIDKAEREREIEKKKEMARNIIQNVLEMKEELRPVVNMLVDMVRERWNSGPSA